MKDMIDLIKNMHSFCISIHKILILYDLSKYINTDLIIEKGELFMINNLELFNDNCIFL